MLIYSEKFDSYAVSGSNRRFGGDAIEAFGQYRINIVPYSEIVCTVQPDHVSMAANAISHIALLRSKNLTIGMLLHRETLTNTVLVFNFHSYLNNDWANLHNFRVTITITDNLQKAAVSYLTGGTGYPAISPDTVYYDLTQPVWVWVQCDMTLVNPGGANGICRVWFNNDLMVTKSSIFTGASDAWPAQPLYAFNNVVRFSCNQTHRIYGIVALNEGMTYMDSALGDVNVLNIAPVSSSYDQFTPHHDGVDLDKENVAVLQDNQILEFASVHEHEHVRGTDHMTRDVHQHDHQPFHNLSHIIAVSHNVTHRKAWSAGKLRIEPVIHTSGRDLRMLRGSGKFVQNHPRTLQANHTIPYAGAFWNEEILGLTSFGYTYYDAALPELVPDGFDLLDEFDVENVLEEMGMLDFADSRMSLDPEVMQMVSDDGFGLVEDVDFWEDAEEGDYSENWSWPHAGKAGYKGPDDKLLVVISGTYQWSTTQFSVPGTPNSDSDGWANSEKMIAHGIAHFPALQQCVVLGERYYLPATGELSAALNISAVNAAVVGASTKYFWSSREGAWSWSYILVLYTNGTFGATSHTKTNTTNVIAFRKPDEA